MPQYKESPSSYLPNMNSSTKKYVLLINNLDGCTSDMVKLKDLFRSFGYIAIEPVVNVCYRKLKEVIEIFKEERSCFHFDKLKDLQTNNKDVLK